MSVSDTLVATKADKYPGVPPSDDGLDLSGIDEHTTSEAGVT